MNLLSLLGLGGDEGNTPPSPPTQSADQYLVPPAAPLDVPTQVGGITATAPPRALAATPHLGAYNNAPEVEAISKVQAQYPHPGTLRSILGVLGDAFLVQAGHNPEYSPWLDRQKIANAGAGFDTDPAGAASRIFATGAPNSAEIAEKIFGDYQTEQLRKQNQEYTNTYREGLQQDREARLNETTQARRDRTDDRRRGIIGGLLSGAAASGDPAKYAAAVAQAKKIRGSNSGIDDSEIPEDINSFQSTYGMSANQVSRNQTSNRSIDERANAANVNHQDRVRGQNIGASTAAARTAVTARGQDMASATADKNRDARKGAVKLAIPGLTVGGNNGGGQQFQQVHTYPSGKKAGWNGSKWVPIN